MTLFSWWFSFVFRDDAFCVSAPSTPQRDLDCQRTTTATAVYMEKRIAQAVSAATS